MIPPISKVYNSIYANKFMDFAMDCWLPKNGSTTFADLSTLMRLNLLMYQFIFIEKIYRSILSSHRSIWYMPTKIYRTTVNYNRY
jgi:hypothetical protein